MHIETAICRQKKNSLLDEEREVVWKLKLMEAWVLSLCMNSTKQKVITFIQIG